MIAALFAAAVLQTATPVAAQGLAVIDCRVTPAGRLRDCRLVSETPTGRNVGAFALKLAASFHVDPKDRRVRAGRIRVPMQFKLP